MADSSQGGAGIGGLLGSIDPSLLANLGLGLLSSGAKNSPLRGNWGAGLMQGEQNYQQQRAATQDYQLKNLQMGLTKAQFQAEMPIYQALGQKLHQMNNDPTTPMQVQGLLGGAQGAQPLGPQMPQGAPPQAGAMPPPQNAAPAPSPMAPNGTLGAPPPPQTVAPNRYRPPAPLPTVGGDPLGDVRTGTMFSMLPQFKGYGEALTNQPKNLQAAQEALVKQRQQQLAEPLSTLDTVAGAANADDIVKNDPELTSRWQEVAPRLGLNPQSGLTPDNARAFARYSYNELAASAQQPAKPMPEVYDTIPGANGQLLQRDRTSGKITEPVPQKLPTFTMEKRWNPTTGRDEGIMVQTSPGGSAPPAAALGASAPPRTAPLPTMPTVGPSRAPATASAPSNPTPLVAPKGGIGTQASAPVDLGYEKPNADNYKAANFANYARTNVALMKQMEDSGYRMSPSSRAAVIDAAVNEDGGKLPQLFSQEYLAHRLSPEDTQYMAALMPVLQASGHSMSGARLTQGQMRTNFESLIPVDSKDPDYLGTVAANRQHLYNGLLAQAGTAVHAPEFEGTLGSDVAAMQKSAPVRVNSPAEARALKPGTQFMTPDGRMKVR